ncbi:MAG: hypothetical protein KIT79_12560 [Deltaproteobacteria bacterium]|nr:hypothetical protein [Deltaproteobacteria bacterium]
MFYPQELDAGGSLQSPTRDGGRRAPIDAPEIFVRWKHLVAVLVGSFAVNWAATMAYIELRVRPVEQAMGDAVAELKETRHALVALATQLAVLTERGGRNGGGR